VVGKLQLAPGLTEDDLIARARLSNLPPNTHLLKQSSPKPRPKREPIITEFRDACCRGAKALWKASALAAERPVTDAKITVPPKLENWQPMGNSDERRSLLRRSRRCSELRS